MLDGLERTAYESRTSSIRLDALPVQTLSVILQSCIREFIITLSHCYSVQRLDLFAWRVTISRLLVGMRTHLKSIHFYITTTTTKC